MELKDLIEKLQEIYKEHGNIDVAVQYRDDGGCYYGSDDELILSVEEHAYKDENGNKKNEKFLIL